MNAYSHTCLIAHDILEHVQVSTQNDAGGGGPEGRAHDNGENEKIWEYVI